MSLWNKSSLILSKTAVAARGLSTKSSCRLTMLHLHARQVAPAWTLNYALWPTRRPFSSKATTTTSTTAGKASSSSNLHAQVSQTLSTNNTAAQQQQSQSPPGSSDPRLDPNAPRGMLQQIFRHKERRARYNQALWNAGAAFMLMVMAAQSLKASRERRRVAKELAAVETQNEERLVLLQLLFQDSTIDRIVDEIQAANAEESEKNGTLSSWFGGSSSSSKPALLLEKQQLANILLRNFDQLVGDTALDEAQRAALRMRLDGSYTKVPAAAAATPTPTADFVDPEPLITENAAAPLNSQPRKRVPFTM